MDRGTIALAEELKTKQLERANRNRPITKKQLVAAMRQTLARVAAQQMHGTEPFSFSTALRGMMALKGEILDSKTAENDVEYVRALSSGTTPGSYLSPTAQANQIISQLQQYSVARAAGATIWPLEKVLELNVPSGVTAPSVIWQAQNSRQTPDAATNFGQLSFTLKSQTALLLIPLQLLRTSKPIFDVILSDSFALACAESEDSALFASSTQSGAPGALMSAAGITLINAAGNAASGGSLLYSDVTAVMLKAAQLRMKPPFVWFCSPRTLYTRLLGLQDTSSRPLLIPDLTDAATSGYSLMGFPLYVTASISESEAVGSGSNQSHLILTTPRSVHIAQDKDISMQIALEAYFDSAQAGLRIGNQIDLGYSPAASIIVLQGIN